MSMKDLFKDALVTDPEKESDFTSIPDGEYIVQLESVEITESKAGKNMIKYQMGVIEGDEAGRKDWKYVMLEDSEGVQKPAALRAQMDFLYELADREITKRSNLDEFQEVMDDLIQDFEDGKGARMVLTVKSSAPSKKTGNVFRNQTLEIY